MCNISELRANEEQELMPAQGWLNLDRRIDRT